MTKVIRKSVGKTLRFEVLKRDSFKCQYCGATAPEVVLHVDHIEAVANGGSNDITNLITACDGCNLGKSDRALDDNAAIRKSRNQLEELQERREQLEMMMEWRKGLRDLHDETVQNLSDYWTAYTKGFCVTDKGREALAKLSRTFSINEICAAMDTAAHVYLKTDGKGDPVAESVGAAFHKIGGICRTTRQAKDDPEIMDLLYIRGILRKRIPGYFNAGKAMELLRDARSWGVSVIALRGIAVGVRNWSDFRGKVEAAVDEKRLADYREEEAKDARGYQPERHE